MAGNARKLREKEARKKNNQFEREAKKKAYEAKIKIGTNSKRKKIAKRKGICKLVADHKNPPSKGFLGSVPPSMYWNVFWDLVS